jgi:hypothetical protein
MNVIAYSPFHDGVSAKAVGGSDRAIVSGAAHKLTRLLRRSGAIGFSSRPATALELGCAATILDVYPTYTLLPMNRVPSSTKLPDKTEPGSPGPASVLRLKLSICEFGNTEV